MRSLVERGFQIERWENEHAIGVENDALFFPFFFSCERDGAAASRFVVAPSLFLSHLSLSTSSKKKIQTKLRPHRRQHPHLRLWGPPLPQPGQPPAPHGLHRVPRTQTPNHARGPGARALCRKLLGRGIRERGAVAGRSDRDQGPGRDDRELVLRQPELHGKKS